MLKPRYLLPHGWIYKCSLDDRHHGYSWVDEDEGWLLRRRQGGGKGFGGEDWIRSASSRLHLANVRQGDVIFCHQGDKSFRALVGITVAARGEYPEHNGNYPNKCTMIDLGTERVPFGNPVTLDEIYAILNGSQMVAYAPGPRQGTFHPVEDELLVPLVERCVNKNPSQRREIVRLTRLQLFERGESPHIDIADEVIRDAVRREICIEVFERRASWARLARKLYGYDCMAPGCQFVLVKEDGERYIEVHHIKPMFEKGSANDKENLSVLCPNHHREVHYAAVGRRKNLTALIRREQARRLAARSEATSLAISSAVLPTERQPKRVVLR
jgi:hypothetical protein